MASIFGVLWGTRSGTGRLARAAARVRSGVTVWARSSRRRCQDRCGFTEAALAHAAQRLRCEVLESWIAVDDRDQVGLRKDGPHHVHDSADATGDQSVYVGRPIPTAVVPGASALMTSTPLLTPESNRTGSPSAASSTPGKQSAVCSRPPWFER